MTKNFESDMVELAGITDKLDRGDVTLDEALSLYERGVKLTIACEKKLADAETRVSIVEREAND